MNYEGINFNEAWVKSKTLDEVLAEMEVNKEVWWPNDPKRVDKAKAMYFLVNPKPKKAASSVRQAASIDPEPE